MKIKSKESEINSNIGDVFSFLSDCNNIYYLLPQDKISDWTADKDSCSFKVQKMATIPLIMVNRVNNECLEMKSGEGAPFPFQLTIILQAKENRTIGFIEFDGQVNAFLKMMVEKPLSNLFDYMSHQLKVRFEGDLG